MKQVLNFINGNYIASSEQFEKKSPVTGHVIAQVHEAGKAEVDAAVAAAAVAPASPVVADPSASTFASNEACSAQMCNIF